jgi:hypothetical protein
MRHRPSSIVVVVVALAFLATACAGTIRDQVRASALVTGEAALSLDTLERDLYAAGIPGYTAEQHKQAGAAIIIVLTTAQTYERAARAWPVTLPTMPKDVWEAQAAALAAIVDVERVLAGVPGTEKLLAALGKIKTQLGGGR